ncbi:MAG: M15 family metallopeptidase [Erysipelotrichaceae bacterium]|nr:M15 family metallopeptidase [Erysipelotrichaceae bacterium]MBQ7889394.1 M15 family metallopeptidase [Erysipelotrichaceae bacterium]
MEENKNIQEETAPEKETNFKMPKIKLPEFNLPKLDLSKLKRLKLKKNAKILLLAVVLLVLVVYGMLTIPGMIDRNNLKKLGYSEEAITKIYELEWEGMILTDELYSDNLNRSIVKENFRKEFLDLYLMTDSLNDDDFLLYSKLILKGYEKADVLSMFNQLEFWEITPLLVFDFVEDTAAYIKDVDDHRVVNSQDSFTLSGNYITYYAETEPVVNQGSIEMMVNKRFALSSDYEPGDLVEARVRYASKGLILSQTAYDTLTQMIDAAEAEEGETTLRMYASSGYRDYAYQEDLYGTYVKRYGEEEADTIAARPGHSEHQTGLTVDMASTSNGGLSKFGDSLEYQWMLKNAHKYGWILRYPPGKEQITGYSAEPWHWRYVGVELATKIYNSKLTFDEYYMLYMAD